MKANTNSCKVCQNEKDNKSFIAKEMMFGTRDEFEYLECSRCGCVQITEIPEQLAKYYPDNYYSFKPTKKGLAGSIDLYVKKQVALSRIGKSAIGGILMPLNKRYLRWLNNQCKVDYDSKILDVGCGGGKLLKEMSHFGFKNLTGVDPFIAKDVSYKPNIQIFKKELSDVDGKYDLIMLHHSFEHMIDPSQVFNRLSKLISNKGRIVIRIPVADSKAYENYGANWVELDAPRHTFLHTKKSIKKLADKAGLRVVDTIYDSSKFEIVGSEKFVRDIPSIENPKLFSKEELKNFEEVVEDYNENGSAGRACFYLEKAS